jgi:MFS family permease
MNISSILKNRGFLNLWINQILVQLAYNCLNFALLVWVYKLTGSSAAVSLMLFAAYLPSAVFGFFSGVLVDISDRRIIIRYINLLLALSILSLVFLKGSLFAVLGIVFLVNSLVQFYLPAEASSIPLICKRKELYPANSLFSITLFGSFLAGFGIAGPLINIWGINYVFLLGAGFLFSAFFLSFFFPPIKSPLGVLGRKLVAALENKNLSEISEVGIKEMKNTFALIRGRVAVMVSLFILASVQVIIAILGALIPSFFENILKTNSANASYILVLPLGIGMVLGGILLSRFGYLKSKRSLVSSGITVAGTLFLLAGFIPLFLGGEDKAGSSLIAAFIAGSFLLGLSMVAVVVPSQTALQEYSPDKDRGKVYAALSVLMAVLTLIPVLTVGVLADIFGTLPITIFMGGFIAMLGVLAFKPDIYFSKRQLPFKVREFLGLGHWKG